MRRANLLRDRGGTTAVEFAVVCPVLFLVLFLILGSCLLLWTKAAMQTAAAQLARCSAIGSSLCGNPHGYVSSLLSAWGASGIFPNFAVNVAADSTCGPSVGRFTAVTITGAGNTWLLPSVAPKILVASSCYPTNPAP